MNLNFLLLASLFACIAFTSIIAKDSGHSGAGVGGGSSGNGDVQDFDGNDGGGIVEVKQQTTSGTTIPPIYVLNLERAPHRWENAQEEMMLHGLDVNRLDAVDGRKLSEQELSTNSTKLAQFFIPKGVVGCYLSHRRFWQMVVDKNLPAAIVFEDDIKLADKFKSTLEKNLEILESQKAMNPDVEYDVLLLGAIGRVHPDDRDAIGSKIFSLYIGGNRPLKTIIKYDDMTYYQPRRAAGTHAYIVSQAGARKLLKLCPKAVFHVDLDAWRHSDLKIRMFSPMLVHQTFEDTSLSDVKSKDMIAKYMKKSSLYKKLETFLADKYTHQPLQHVLDEPIIQLGSTSNGVVITVERHLKWVGWGIMAAMGLSQFTITKPLVKPVHILSISFCIGIKGITWILMNWK